MVKRYLVPLVMEGEPYLLANLPKATLMDGMVAYRVPLKDLGTLRRPIMC